MQHDLPVLGRRILACIEGLGCLSGEDQPTGKRGRLSSGKDGPFTGVCSVPQRDRVGFQRNGESDYPQ